MKRFLFFTLLVWANLFSQTVFTQQQDSAGLQLGFSGEGVCVLDFNRDGLEDLFFTDLNGRNRLFENLGGLKFRDVTVSAGIDSMVSARPASAADYDNDGWPDLFVGGVNSASRLYHNNGDGTFSNVIAGSGIQTNSDLRGACWCDVNQDGLVDLYLSSLKAKNQLYINQGNGQVREMALAFNAAGPTAPGLVMGAAFFDMNWDGNEDIFLTQDGNLGNVLLKRDGAAGFADVSQSSGVVLPVQGMGVDVGDYNRDGWLDVYTTNLDQNSLLKNNGNSTFSDLSAASGAADVARSMGWGTFFFDADNDGWLDIYNNNQSGFGQIPNSFFLNRRDGTFSDESASSGVKIMNDGIGAAFADLDNDGDLDIVLNGKAKAGFSSVILLRNEGNGSRHWIQFDLEGTVGNRDAIGARLALFSPGGRQVSFVAAGNGYASQSSLRQHFGLNSDAVVDSLIVYWPGGRQERFAGFAANQRYRIIQGSGITAIEPKNSDAPREFRLFANYPNPFNPTTLIPFQMDRQARIKLEVFNVSGQKVATLLNEIRPPGRYRVRWNAVGLPSGIYFFRLTENNRSRARKALLVK